MHFLLCEEIQKLPPFSVFFVVCLGFFVQWFVFLGGFFGWAFFEAGDKICLVKRTATPCNGTSLFKMNWF